MHQDIYNCNAVFSLQSDDVFDNTVETKLTLIQKESQLAGPLQHNPDIIIPKYINNIEMSRSLPKCKEVLGD